MYPHLTKFMLILSCFWLNFCFSATAINVQGIPITTAAYEVAGPMDFGSGHIRPAHSADPGLIYDATYDDYLLFACSSSNAQLDPSFPCPCNPPSPSNLNHPSVAVARLCGTVNLTRTVTNVGRGEATYRVSVNEPNGVETQASDFQGSRGEEELRNYTYTGCDGKWGLCGWWLHMERWTAHCEESNSCFLLWM